MVCNLLTIRQLTCMQFNRNLGPSGVASHSNVRAAMWALGFMLVFLVTVDSYGQQTNTNAPGFQVQNNGKGGGSDNGNEGNNGKGKGKSKPTVAERPQVIGSKGSSTEKGKPERPGNPNSQNPAEVTALVNKFQTARQEFLAAQREMALQKKDATEEQRAALREKYKEAMERWKEERKQFVEEQKERMKDIKQELHPDLGKIVDGAGGDGGNGRDR
jgi:transketolase